MVRKILVTGSGSYVGRSFIKWMSSHKPEIECVEISLRGNEWREIDFSSYDSIIHVAGIAHVNSKIFKDEDYYKVNSELTFNVATKAKNDGVPHFVFMSSIIVYNDSTTHDGMITNETIPYSKNAYGNSKIRAEELLKSLIDDNFKVAIVRPPMIYGPGSKGNFPRLSKFAKQTPVFPFIINKRSMLYIDNLSYYLFAIIIKCYKGIIIPQNQELVCTTELVREVSRINGNKVFFTKVFNPLIYITAKFGPINKVFGNLWYVENEENLIDKNLLVSFTDSIRITLGVD